MSRLRAAILAGLACAGLSSAALAEPVIGSVVRVQGEATGTTEGASQALASGTAVYRNEVIVTGVDARLELGFDDGTRLTVGEKSRIVLDEFVYAPAGVSRFHASITGPFRYISGKLGLGATRAAGIETPFATIGIRGTDFWGGPIDGANGIVVFEGEVSVTTPAGTVILSAPREGANIAAPGSPAVVVPEWSPAKIDRAVATVTFR